MSAVAIWTREASLRLHCLVPGPCTPATADYDLAGGGRVTVPLTLPLAPPTVAGQAVMTLPAPPGGGLVAYAVLRAADGAALMTVTCHPAEVTRDGGTWQVPVRSPGALA